jgi:hypothetical protein
VTSPNGFSGASLRMFASRLRSRKPRACIFSYQSCDELHRGFADGDIAAICLLSDRP